MTIATRPRSNTPSKSLIFAFGESVSRRSVDRKSTRLNSSHVSISYAVFCLKKKKQPIQTHHTRPTQPSGPQPTHHHYRTQLPAYDTTETLPRPSSGSQSSSSRSRLGIATHK